MSPVVLITRHASECGELQRMLSPSGITLKPYPVLRIEDVDDVAGLARAVRCVDDGGRPVWVVMASPRAPKRWVRYCRARGADTLLVLPVAVVGQGTATAAMDSGLDPTVVGSGTGAGLAAELVDRFTAPTTVIFGCGHDRRPELPDALAAAGHRVVPVVLYRMRATPAHDLPPVDFEAAAVVVTSPRAAGLYLEGVGGRPLHCPHWALGPTTRDAAESLGIHCSIPPEPNLKSLAEELCRI